MKKLSFSAAFTLIEVLISVLIISGSIVYALKIHSANREQIIYISERAKLSLQDSLFLPKEALTYHKEEKTAYDVLERFFRVKETKSRDILKKIKRNYFIPEPLKIEEGDEGIPGAIVDEIKIKDQYSSSYFHFKINTF